MKIIVRLCKKIEEKIDTYSIQKKLILLYVCCVVLPVALTDSVVVGMIFSEEHNARKQVTENIASVAEYSIDKAVEEALTISKNIYMNKYINNFLNADYDSHLAFYEAYQELMQDSLFDSSLGNSSVEITMYADNDTIVNGGKFKKVSIIRKLNRYMLDPHEKVLKIDLDYNAVNTGLLRANYESEVYICSGDKIIFSNTGRNNIKESFERFDKGTMHKCYVQEKELYGQPMKIYVRYPEIQISKILWNNAIPMILLVLINIFLPWVFMQFLNRSFTVRLHLLEDTFSQDHTGKLKVVETISGTDEISQLMQHYNSMANRMNHLIETVYESRLKQQESEIARQDADIARQKAELLALHSQINPHFLFNVLENIRMRSILKHEDETAEMIEQLSLIERQYVEWGTDIVSLGAEIGFVESYLKLQKYRFGDRLRYSIEMEDDCREYRIPKLSLVTFTENSCVHGIEGKASQSWIFVRVYKDKNNLHLEVEDTGEGMPEEYLNYLQERMEEANIEMLKEKGRVGVINACVRLKMYTGDHVKFHIESERGVGTEVSVVIPLNAIS